MMKGKWGKILILAIIAAAVVAFFQFGGRDYLSFEVLKARQQEFANYFVDHAFATIAIYMAIYILVTALSLPGATIMTLAGGAMFGFWIGLVVVSFASTIGATCAFLIGRFLFRDVIQAKFKDKLAAFNRGFEEEGAFYLFTLRLVPVFPFFMVNIVTSVMPIAVSKFFFASQIGMLPGTMAYVNAGTQLASLKSASGILSPQIIGAFAILGILPLIIKKALNFVKARRSLA